MKQLITGLLVCFLPFCFPADASAINKEDIVGQWRLLAIASNGFYYDLDKDSIAFNKAFVSKEEDEKESLETEIRSRFRNNKKQTLSLMSSGHYVIILTGETAAGKYQFNNTSDPSTLSITMPDTQQEELLKVNRTGNRLYLYREDEDEEPLTMIFILQ